MKTKKKKQKRIIGSSPMTTITIERKDRDFLENLKKKKQLVSIGALMSRIINTIKLHKFEEEIQ